MKSIGIFALALCTVLVAADEYHPRKSSSRANLLKAGKAIAPVGPIVNVMEASRTFWRDRAQNSVKSKVDQKTNTKKRRT
jgi:hypothetical protein